MRTVSGFVDGVLVEIYDKPVVDREASKDSEVPIYKAVTYIRKRVANSRNVYDQPMKSTDYEKYRDLHAAFEAGEKVPMEGTPLEQWPGLDVADIETLKSFNIFTVQSLAELNETGIHRLPAGFRNLKIKAMKWLNQGKEVEELRKQNQELLERIEKLEANQKKKPGRPRKTEAA